MAHHAGYNSRVQINLTTYCAMRWSVNDKVDELDVTDFCDGGFASYIRGVREAEVTLEFYWEDTEDLLDPNAVNFNVGRTIAVRLYPDVSAHGATFWNFPTILITSVSMDAEVRGAIKLTITGKSVGSYTEPGV